MPQAVRLLQFLCIKYFPLKDTEATRKHDEILLYIFISKLESPPAWTQEAYRPQEGARCWPPPTGWPDPPPGRLGLTPPVGWLTWPPPHQLTDPPPPAGLIWPPPQPAGPDPPQSADWPDPPPASWTWPPWLAGPDPPRLAGPDPPPQVWTDKQSETITFPSYYVRAR